jgi:hypothetical protein
VRRLEEEEKIWDDYLEDLRDWHERGGGLTLKEARENKDNQVADLDDLPF